MKKSREERINDIKNDYNGLCPYLTLNNEYKKLPDSYPIHYLYKDPIDEFCKKYDNFGHFYTEKKSSLQGLICYYNLDLSFNEYIIMTIDKSYTTESEIELCNKIDNFYKESLQYAKKIKDEAINDINISYL